MSDSTEEALVFLKEAADIHASLVKDCGGVCDSASAKAWLEKASLVRGLVEKAREAIICAIESGTTREALVLKNINQILGHIDTAEKELRAYEFGS